MEILFINILIMTTIFISTPVDGSHLDNSGYPIIWRKSKHHLATQIVQAEIKIKLQNPCSIVDRLRVKAKTNATHFLNSYNWESCVRGYVKRITKPFRHYCPNNAAEADHSIQKRGIINFVFKTVKWVVKMTAAIGLVGVIHGIGDQIFPDHDEIDYKTLETQINNNFLKVITKMHQNQLELEQQVREVSIMSTLNSRFIEMENTIKQMFRPDNEQLAWQLKTLFPNISLGHETMDEYWTMESCQLKEEEGVAYDELVLFVNAIKMDPEYSLLRADPFYIVHEETAAELWERRPEFCLSEYIGPQYVVYHQKTRCFREIPFNPIADHQTLMLFHSELCKAPIKTENVRWRKTKCESHSRFISEELVQIKWDRHFVYYYCYTQNITRGSQTVPCRNQVYKEKRGENVTINGRTVFAKSLHLESFSIIGTEVSDFVNEEVFDSDELKGDLKNLESLVELENKLVTKITTTYVRKASLLMVGGTLVVIMALAILYITYQCKKTTKNRDQRAREFRELMRSNKLHQEKA